MIHHVPKPAGESNSAALLAQAMSVPFTLARRLAQEILRRAAGQPITLVILDQGGKAAWLAGYTALTPDGADWKAIAYPEDKAPQELIAGAPLEDAVFAAVYVGCHHVRGVRLARPAFHSVQREQHP